VRTNRDASLRRSTDPRSYATHYQFPNNNVQGQPLVECHAIANIFEGQSGSSIPGAAFLPGSFRAAFRQLSETTVHDVRSSSTNSLRPRLHGCWGSIRAVMDCHRRHFGGLMRILAISPADVFLEPIWQRRGVLDLENHSRASAASRGEGCHRGPCRSNKTAKSTSGNLARRISAGAVAPVAPAGPSLNAHRAAPPRVTCGPFFVEVLLKRASRGAGMSVRPVPNARGRQTDRPWEQRARDS
jgi:hypothetical protein